MRSGPFILAGLLAGAVASVTSEPALAQQQPATGCQARNALGVSRTIEVDATRGPRFGHQQYKDLTILQPGEVVLTFDDGPLRPYTKPVLEALAAHCTRATFFLVGRMAVADPDMVQEVARRGHTVATHTWSHRNLRSVGAAAARHEIELGLSTVKRAAGQPISPFFRFPYLSDPTHAQAYLQQRNIAMFSIEVDSNDYRTKDPGPVHRTVMSQLMAQGKGIILFHDIQPSTAGALRKLLDELAVRNFKVVHIVPKVGAVTLPEFDALAEKEMSRRRTVIAAQPLAPRAMTWPVASPAATSAPLRPTGQGIAAPSQIPSAAIVAPPASALPPAPAPVAAPAPIERPVRDRGNEPSWQQRAFGNQ
jgi:peptidoglycan/xylan/chitin deacetylase (PgdA/CDA1 family)